MNLPASCRCGGGATVDDEPLLRRALALSLERAGHSVVKCEKRKRAVEYLAHDEADLLITDIMMPEMDGVETIRVVRRRRPELPIIAMSGGLPDPADYLGLARYFGATAILAKPFQPSELVEIVERLLAENSPVR
jgi:CheY-like chemotaxis protein